MGYLYRDAIIKLSANYNMLAAQLEKLVEISCALHDVGKLSVKWQKAVREWQQYKNPQKLSDEPVAHSDYDPDMDFEKKKSFPKQPPHASEGAYAVARWLIEYCGNNAVAIWTVITRHHGAFTDSLEDFRLVNGAEKWVGAALSSVIGGIALTDSPDRLAQGDFKNELLIFSKNDADLWPLYVFLVRRLRLSDQKSQKGEGK